MLVLALQLTAALTIIALIGVIAMLQMDRFEGHKKQLAAGAFALIITGGGTILILEEIQPFIWTGHGQFGAKKGGNDQGADRDGPSKGDGDEGGGSGASKVALSGDGSGRRGIKAVNSFRDCDTCPEMMIIPAGTFSLGAADGENDAEPQEKPQIGGVEVKSFALGRFEITVEEYATFLKASGRKQTSACSTAVLPRSADAGMARAVLVSTGNGAAPTFARPGYDQTEWHPAVCVSFHDAQAYVAWMKKITGKPYRLPSAAEWEYAARATTVTPFVGGASLTDDEARIANPAAAIGPVSVGSYSSNGYRLHDMHGNVAEWTEDCATSSLRGVPRDGSAQNQVPGCQRVFKGGSWSEPASRARSAARTARDASAAGTWIGFRAARDMN